MIKLQKTSSKGGVENLHKEEGRKGRSKWEEEFYFSLNIFVLQQVAASGTRRGDFFGYSHVSLGPAVPDKQSKLLLLLVVGLEWFFECYFFFCFCAREAKKYRMLDRISMVARPPPRVLI